MGFWLGGVGFKALVKVAGALDGVLAGWSGVLRLCVGGWALGLGLGLGHPEPSGAIRM
jgi:hypothetical protein